MKMAAEGEQHRIFIHDVEWLCRGKEDGRAEVEHFRQGFSGGLKSLPDGMK